MIELTLDQALGLELRAARVRKGLSQEALAFGAGLHRTYISILEQGEKSPTLSVLARIAPVLGCSVSELIRNAEQRQVSSAGETPT